MNESTQVSPRTEPKPQIAAGGPLAALVPQNIEEAFRLSQALASAGDMVPKHFQGKPQEIMAAVMRGAEIGLMPMQALSNIAVINGRASIWGDALPALMQRAGHHLDCVIEGVGDDRMAVATLTRGDNGKVIARQFSVADAKKASLWGKAGPWQSYPDRMLQMRARSYAARDGAADALMGLQVAEEMQDAPRMKDVTPKEGPNLAQLIQKSGQRLQDIAPQAATPPVETEVASDEVAEPEAQEAAPDAAYRALADDGAPGSAAWDRGISDMEDGKPLSACPYDPSEDRNMAADWCAAWLNAERARA